MRLTLIAAAAFAGAALVAAAIWLRPAPPPQPVENRAFRSAPNRNAPAVVWAVGDGADGSDAARRVAARILANRPRRVLYLGDVYESGSPADFRERFATVYGGLARITAPTPGNHDWPAHPEGYDAYWRSVTGAPTPPWYAFTIGGWRIVSLNSETPDNADQLSWLDGELRRNDGNCMLAFWHRPRFSAGRHGDQDSTAPLWDALRGQAAIVVSGHDHDLQRFRPRDGIVQFVAGAGGRHRYSVAADSRLAFASDTVDGALRLSLAPGRAAAEFIAANGSTLDRTTVACASGGR